METTTPPSTTSSSNQAIELDSPCRSHLTNEGDKQRPGEEPVSCPPCAAARTSWRMFPYWRRVRTSSEPPLKLCFGGRRGIGCRTSVRMTPRGSTPPLLGSSPAGAVELPSAYSPDNIYVTFQTWTAFRFADAITRALMWANYSLTRTRLPWFADRRPSHGATSERRAIQSA